jgi:deoxyribonuclease-4
MAFIPPIGAHVSAAGGLPKAIERISAIGGEALQIFVSSPRTWKVTPLADDIVQEFNNKKVEAGIKAVLVHALYLCNFASDNSDLWDKSVEAISGNLRSADRIGADVCFHVGSHKGSGLQEGLKYILPALSESLSHCGENGAHLLLENSAGAGGTVGRSIEELAQIIDAAGSPDKLGICLDTCHLFVSGYDLRDQQVVEDLIEKIKNDIGLERLRAIHANDSKAPLGSNKDRHENILDGEMGAALATFLTHPSLTGIPVFLETPGINKSGPNAEQITRLRSLYS